MRGDAITKGAAVWVGVFGLLGLFAGCQPPEYESHGPTVPTVGRLALSWTLNGVTLTPESCQKERISSMNVLVVSDYDPNQNIEFINVTCGLDRFSVTMAPIGTVRLLIDGVWDLGNGKTCRRYSGQASTYAMKQFPTAPLSVPLVAVTGCP